MSENKNPQFANMDELLDASMDDLADLPAMGVPPTGSYLLNVTASREQPKEGKGNEYIKFEYTVVEIQEVKHEEELNDVKVEQKFTTMFSPFKKDGTINDTGIGYMKKALEPFAQHYGTKGLGDTIANIKDCLISASLVRVQDKNDETRFNARFKDVVVQ